MKNLTPTEHAELEAFGAAIADRVEADGPSPGSAIDIDNLPPEIALQHAALRRAIALREADEETSRAVERAREAGMSWHKIALPLGLTAEGARRRYARKVQGPVSSKRRGEAGNAARTKPSGHAA